VRLTRLPAPGSRARQRPAAQSELAPRVAVTITTVVIVCFFAIALTYVARANYSPLSLALALGLMLVLLVLQLCHSFPALMPRAARHRRKSLLLQALLTYLPFTLFGAAWLGMPGFLAASGLLILRPAAAWTAFGAVVASIGVIQFAVGFGSGDLAYNMVATALTGAVVYGLSRLNAVIREVQAAREELTRLAITQERLRFARDLHDLLGFSLSTITLKCELTYRLVRTQPARAEAEITEILQAARQAMSDVRSVASSYLQMSLSREVSAAASLLRAVGIHTEVHCTTDRLSSAVDTALATVLREGITNMLRHSKAQHCVIEADSAGDRVRVSVANDGVGAERSTLEASGEGGSGLRNLTTRVEALGGVLTATERPDGWFVLTADLPAVAAGQDDEDGPDANRTALLTASRNPPRSEPRPSGSEH
jgi:two-component system sensor histidine kinase DesK